MNLRDDQTIHDSCLLMLRKLVSQREAQLVLDINEQLLMSDLPTESCGSKEYSNSGI